MAAPVYFEECAMKRYLIEFGMGADLHGGDCNVAAARALRDAVSHCCMAGIADVCGITDPLKQMKLIIKVAVPYPEQIDLDALYQTSGFSPENAEIEIAEGGMTSRGLHVEAYGEGDHIMIANAVITVFVDV